jgi:hypothetical protein
MISHKYGYIFVHVPKCGGTSFEKFLFEIEGVSRPDYLGNLSKENKRKYFLDHRKNQVHCFHSEIDITLREEYFSFSIVRNPFDRVVSEYTWDPQFKNISFLDFLNMQNKWQPRHKNAQVDFMDKHLNFIGRFENLQDDFNTICDKIGIPQRELPHKNKGKHKHYTEYYDDETREIVAEKYAKDLECFGYVFGG